MSFKVFYKNTKFEYAVNKDGAVVNFTTGRILKPQKKKVGYFEIRYGGRKDPHSDYVHRLVAQVFVENPKGWNVVNHKDGCKLNNAVINLEWVKHNENMHHCAFMGLIKNQRSKKLTPDEVFDIRTLGLYGFRAREISESFGVHENTIRKILNCEDWRHEKMPERNGHERGIQGMEFQKWLTQNINSLPECH